MVLPAPPAHALPVEPPWFDKLVVAIELSARGVLTLVDNAAPARLREAYLRLRVHAPMTDVIVDVRRLAQLPPGTTAILALKPPIDSDDLDWLNLNRPVVSDRRLNIVLWCEDEAAAVLALHAPDFFDWISARVDCPAAPTAHAVADVKRAICARASGIAWDGPGFEETLTAVRSCRPVRRVAVASYRSMIDALTSHEPGWLFLEGIDTDFHLRRLRWAMAETGRRVIVLRKAIGRTAPGWWTTHAMHISTAEAVHALEEVSGSGRLAALIGLDPDACAYARLALRRGIEATRLEELLATASDPRATLQDFTRQSGWNVADVIAEGDPQRALAATRLALEREVARHVPDDDPIVLALRGPPLGPEPWDEIGSKAEGAGDFEVAIRWLTAALRSLPEDANPRRVAHLRTLRGQAHRGVGDVTSALEDLELAYSIARSIDDTAVIARSATSLMNILLEQGDRSRAREYMESALHATAALGDEAEVAVLLDSLARALQTKGDLTEARLHLERALSIKRRAFATEDHPSIAVSLAALVSLLMAQGDVDGAHRYLEHVLEIDKRLWEQDQLNDVVTLRAMADVLRATGDMRGARARLERALALQRVSLGSDEHPDIATTRVELARVIAALGDLDRAKAVLEPVGARGREVLRAGSTTSTKGAVLSSRAVILFLAANPAGAHPLALDRECAAIERELSLTPGRDDFDLRSKWAVTVDEIMRHLLDLQPTIVHFSGHGDAAGLRLVDDDGQPHPVTPAALRMIIQATASTVRLAVLNACYNDAQAEALRDAVDCVIGTDGAIVDEAARAFAIDFYRALGHRRSVGRAYEHARATLAAKGLTTVAPRCLVRLGVDVDKLVLGGRAPAAFPPTSAFTTRDRATPRYDLFLVHSSADMPSARSIYDLLQPDVRVFLDERSLQPGDRWDQQIPAAQRASRATVILISRHSDPAWYLSGEIVTAIALHRASPAAHLLVPVLLKPGIAVPYGLSHIQAIDAVAEGGLAGVATRLREVVARMRDPAGPLVVPVTPRDGGADAQRLYSRLSRLTDSVFEQILLYAQVDRHYLAPRTAPLAERILDVVQLAAVDPELYRRINALLDQRAPWTRDA